MKLIKCYISAFGKLKDFSYDFNDNLNTIIKENGWGKSTFATFIKSMFYGLNDSKRSVAENERLKYKPWGSTEKFGGYLIFTVKDKEYKLERFFGAKASDDTVKLFDVVSGKEYPVKEELGKHIFKIDEEGFLSTTYFSQKDFQAKSNTSLTAKFNDVCEIQDSGAFDQALEKLENKAKTYKYRGDRGLIPDAKRDLFAVDEQMIRAERAVETVSKLKSDAETLNKEIENLQLKSNKLTERVGVAGKVEALSVKKSRYDKLIDERKKLAETDAAATDVLNGNVVTKSQIEGYERRILDIVSIDAKIDSIKADIAEFEKSDDFAQNKKISSLDMIFCIAALLLCALSVVLSLVIKLVIFTIIAILFGVLAIAAGINLFYKHNAVKQKSAGVKNLLEQKRKEFVAFEKQKQEIENCVDEYISRFNLGQNFDRSTSLNYILKAWEIKSDVSQKLAETSKELEDLKFSIEDYKKLEDEKEDISALNAQLKSLQFVYNQKSRELAEKRSAIRIHEDLASSITDLESRSAELKEKLRLYEEEQEILNLTIQYLKLADENLKIKYKAPLQNSLKKYFETINGVDKKVNIDVDFKVTVEESGEQKVTEYYSKGYQNLFEICKRFALTDVLFVGEKPFVILDDPFYNLDDAKLAASLQLIKELSKEYQILYLVCHESRGA